MPPFSCTFSSNIPELLWQLNISLAISTYQAGKVVLISARDQDHLVQLPRTFAKAMGIAFKGNQLAIATQDEVVVLANHPDLAASYPVQPNLYDAFYVPRASYYTSMLDIHDLDWIESGLCAVNTQFSCLSLINDQYSFTPIWKPSFISELKQGDRCHLNGLAVKDGKPAYITALGQTDSPEGWRENKINGGILMDVDSGEVILDQLSMPHSPRLVKGDLYLLLSAKGELVKVNLQHQSYEVIRALPGFARGLAFYEDYWFIGLSKLRTTSATFQDLPIAGQSVFAGIIILHEPTRSMVGQIKYETSVEEIFDVQVIPGVRRPGILNTEKSIYKMAVSSPEGSFWGEGNTQELKQ